jgi:hypothetical protein
MYFLRYICVLVTFLTLFSSIDTYSITPNFKLIPDSLKNISQKSVFSINPIEIEFLDFSLNYENISKKNKYGINLGYTFPVYKSNRPIFLFAFHYVFYESLYYYFGLNNETLPFNVYQGPEIKYYYQWKVNKNSLFIGSKFVFKYLYYKNKTLCDQVGNSEERYVYYKRNEKAFVTGIELLLSKDYYHRKFCNQVYFSLGYRMKIRNIITTSHWGVPSYFLEKRPLGEKHETNFFPTINIGLKFGLYIRNKNKKSV